MSDIEVGSVWINRINDVLTLTITHNLGKAVRGMLSDGRPYDESVITLNLHYRPESNEESCDRKNQELKDDMSTIYDQSEPKHSHYHKDVSQYDTIDIYIICDLYVEDNSGCIQHAVKKLLCGGKRGAKDELKDLQEAIDTIQRKIEILQSKEGGQ